MGDCTTCLLAGFTDGKWGNIAGPRLGDENKMNEMANKDQTQQPTAKLPASARVVVIGGGAVGASVLYHLAELDGRIAFYSKRMKLTRVDANGSIAPIMWGPGQL